MHITDITSARLHNLQISGTNYTTPAEILHHLGAIQSQDYPHSKWATGLRLPGSAETSVEKAFAEKSIVRSWSLRGTLHTTAAEDLRWILSLVAPRIIASNASRYRQLELDDRMLSRCKDLLVHALEGGRQLTRNDLSDMFAAAGIEARNIRLTHILHRAAVEQLICYGVKQGNQFTFSLLDEWLPPTPSFSREEALAELARRFFQSRGPATLQDFIWWSGLTVTDARKGVSSLEQGFGKATFDDITYWFPENPITLKHTDTAFLLAGFDEYIVGYRDRSICIPSAFSTHVIQSNGLFNATVVTNGQVTGTWKRTVGKDTVLLEVFPFTSWGTQEQVLIRNAAADYAYFLGKELKLEL